MPVSAEVRDQNQNELKRRFGFQLDLLETSDPASAENRVQRGSIRYDA